MLRFQISSRNTEGTGGAEGAAIYYQYKYLRHGSTQKYLK